MSRYIVFELLTDGRTAFSSDEAASAITKAVLLEIGSTGAALAEFRVMRERFEPKLQRGIIKTNIKGITGVRAALALITNIGGQKVLVNVRGVSGTIKSGMSKFMVKKRKVMKKCT